MNSQLVKITRFVCVGGVRTGSAGGKSAMYGASLLSACRQVGAHK